MIKNGLIKLNNIYEIPFKQDLIPISNKYARPAITMIPEYITIHNTGNNKKGANAEMHTEYVDNATGYVSWHFTVDDKQIIQELPITESAYHAGDGRNGMGNRKSIGIEICEYEGIDWSKAKENAVKLIVFLIENVNTLQLNPAVPHQKWSGKYCPHKILDEGWDKFLQQIKGYKESLEKSMDWKAILNKCASNPTEWENAINTAVNASKADGNLGALEIFKYLPELIEKIYNKVG